MSVGVETKADSNASREQLASTSGPPHQESASVARGHRHEPHRRRSGPDPSAWTVVTPATLSSSTARHRCGARQAAWAPISTGGTRGPRARRSARPCAASRRFVVGPRSLTAGRRASGPLRLAVGDCGPHGRSVEAGLATSAPRKRSQRRRAVGAPSPRRSRTRTRPTSSRAGTSTRSRPPSSPPSARGRASRSPRPSRSVSRLRYSRAGRDGTRDLLRGARRDDGVAGIDRGQRLQRGL